MSDHPRDLRYTKDHEWARVEGDTVTIGITGHAVEQLGDVTLVDLSVKAGDRVTAGKVFGTVESVKTVSDLFAPVSGVVTAVNAELNQRPELVNENPYGVGWMVRVTLSTSSEVDGLLTADAYDALLKGS
jgi:glycine cleavage system H protein